MRVSGQILQSFSPIPKDIIAHKHKNDLFERIEISIVRCNLLITRLCLSMLNWFTMILF